LIATSIELLVNNRAWHAAKTATFFRAASINEKMRQGGAKKRKKKT
jgi:hypothetical protein